MLIVDNMDIVYTNTQIREGVVSQFYQLKLKHFITLMIWIPMLSYESI